MLLVCAGPCWVFAVVLIDLDMFWGGPREVVLIAVGQGFRYIVSC